MASTRNIGILAHVDAGKTTVTERILFACGVLRQPGSVDKGDSQSDTLEVERRRGISVRLSTVTASWRGVRLNLMDTPGHVDFAGEVERGLRALDGAVLVLSAVEGVQAHTETLWRALEAQGVPRVLLVNKLDRVGADAQAVVEELRATLGTQAILLQRPEGEGARDARVVSRWSPDHQDAALVEQIVETDEALLERYLQDEALDFDTLDGALACACHNRELTPVLLSVAKDGVGIPALLDAMVRYLPDPAGRCDDPVAGVVYQVQHTPRWGRMVAVRLHGGRVKVRDELPNPTRGTVEKISLIKRIQGSRLEDAPELLAGDVALVAGLSSARVGDVLGEGEGIPAPTTMGEPLLTVQLVPRRPRDFTALAQALTELADEDPALDLQWIRDPRELHVRVRGWMQIEILQALLEDRHGLAVDHQPPTIIYKETPASVAEGYERYWMPKPCWAILTLRVEPGPLGSGVSYRSEVSVDDVAARYQNEIERALPKALSQGPKGWEVTDLRVTLVQGEHHTVHTKPGDFAIATPMAMMNGLVEADTVLLEPILGVRIRAPEELLGAVSSDLNAMRADLDPPGFEGGRFVLTARVPARLILDYPIRLSSRSGGKGEIRSWMHSYQPCEPGEGETRPYLGVSPLDRAKYILHARNAL